jgi:tetratricopeptide (TPR) repeat protein
VNSPNSRCDELIRAAGERRDRDENEAACELYQQCLSIDPDHPVALRELGLICWGFRNQPEKSREYLERCVEICDDVDAHFYLAHAYEELGWIDKARTEYEIAVEWYDSHKDPLEMHSLVHAHYAMFLASHLDFPAAEEHYKKALLIEPGCEPAQIWYAKLKEWISQRAANPSGKLDG